MIDSLDVIVTVLVFGVCMYIASKLPGSACTGNCNQGRNCNCKGRV